MVALEGADFGEILADQFSKNLLAFPDALTHVTEDRGISIERVAKGEVGFCPPLFEYHFPLLKGRITVPIRDVHGRVVAFAGRQYMPMWAETERSLWKALSHRPGKADEVIQKWLKGKWINEKFPKHFHLFHMDVAKLFARERGYVVIVEGYFDALVLASYGIPNVAAVCGTSLSEYHIATIARYCDRIVLLLDADEAGSKGVARCLPIIKEAGMTPYVLTLPKSTDPDEFVLEYGGDLLNNIIQEMIDKDKYSRRIEINND